MKSLLTLIRPGESWGDQATRTHEQDSALHVEHSGGSVLFRILQGAVNSADPANSRPECAAVIRLSPEAVETLAAYLATLKDAQS
jgi:hypothetical protein